MLGKFLKFEFLIVKINKDLVVLKVEKGGWDLFEVLKEVDECFVKVVESGEIVLIFFDMKKVYYYLNFLDSLRGDKLKVFVLDYFVIF